MQSSEAPGSLSAAQIDAGLQIFLANWTAARAGGLSTVCALLQVSTACRRAVQQSTAFCTVHFNSEEKINKAADFAAWLPRHPGLVQHLIFGYHWVARWRAGEQLLHSALLHYLAVRAATPAAVQNRPVLALNRLDTPWMLTPAVFSTLAEIGSITSLRQELRGEAPSAAVCAALGAVSSLKQLYLRDRRSTSFGSRSPSWVAPRDGPAPAMPPALAAALQQLPQLQILDTETPMLPHQLQLLPPSLNQLSVILRPAQEDSYEVHVDLRHLTNLTSLALQCAVPVSAHSALPDSVLKLTVEGGCHAVASTRLQSLRLTAPSLCMELVRQVPSLPQLRYLDYSTDDRFGQLHVDGMRPAVAVISAATQLTGLTLDLTESSMLREGRRVTATLHLGRVLKGLVNLEELILMANGAPTVDLIELTALTKLTNLSLCSCGATDMVVSALACRLLRLQKLDLQYCAMRTQAFLPPIGALPDLRDLDLCENTFKLTDLGLMQLSRLTRLTHLLFDKETVSSEAVAAFLAAVPSLDRIGFRYTLSEMADEDDEEGAADGGA